MLAIQRFTAVGAIDAAFWLYRQHFWLLFAISLIVAVPVTCMAALLAYVQAISDTVAALTLLTLLNLLVSVVAGAFGTAATTHVASSVALGQVPTIGNSLNAARRVFAHLLAATLLVGLGVGMCALLGGAFAAAISLGLLSPGTTQRVVMGVLIVLGVLVPALMFLARWSLIAPIVVVEEARAARALGRSGELTEGRRWKILGVIGLYLLASLSIGAGLASLASLLGKTHVMSQLLQAVVNHAFSAIVSPILYVAVALLYYDARVEHEAFDVAMLARQSVPGQV